MPATAATDARAAFNTRLTRYRRQLERYARNPDDDAIHDLRTSTRRLESAFEALPRVCKTGAPARYLHQAKQLFRLNSQIRDCDVMATKLETMGVDSNSPLLTELRRTRRRELRHAMKEAERLRTVPRPRVKPVADGAPFLAMRVHRQALRFLANRPLVLADEANVEEIHAMRKDAKKLFYLLEQDDRLGSLQQRTNIRMFQRLTGEIHDADVTIEFLQQRRSQISQAKTLLEIERSERHAYYQELLGLLQDSSWEALARLGRPR